ncbi:hypothetical protein [Kitasatospora aureofaciens]|uniref:hypothetical protein n=1 Tax=Kitasatospora aureofaciens TaxID=1894 RepID=UPI001C488430|nr:hypothetical protein [Kitasatospora aureofaciens]MBV6700641.1 hypothetical protein [Kitasatospora aureofaciens]
MTTLEQQPEHDGTTPDLDTGTGGYCQDCGDYGFGLYAGMRTALTDWITKHVGCPSPSAADTR